MAVAIVRYFRAEASQLSSSYLPSLTPLRGIAAMGVVLFHFCRWFPNLDTQRYTGAINNGYLAVDLFFILSGFVITHVYKERLADQLTASGYGDFIKARIARIYPLHITMLLVFAVTAVLGRVANFALKGAFGSIPLLGERSLAGFFANLALVQGLWARQLSWDNPAWTISLEFVAYVLFPLFFPLIWRARPAAKAIIGGVIFMVLGWLAYQTNDYLNQWNGLYAIIRCFPEFLAGILAYSIYHSELMDRILASDLTLAAVLIVLGFLIQTGGPDIGIIALFPVLMLTAVRNRGGLGRLLNAAPLRWLGDISYSLYLVHWYILFIAREAALRVVGITPQSVAAGPALALTIAMIGVSLGFAAVTYRVIEVPGRRWLRQRLTLAGQRRIYRLAPDAARRS
jgi:peptidoglycan/LPS O-acetylase OafA/YrhL